MLMNTQRQLRTLYVDGFDLARLGFGLSSPQGLWSTPSARYTTVTIPGRAGAVVVGDPRHEPRQIVLSGIIEAASSATLTEAGREVTERLNAGLVTLRFRDRLDVEFRATLSTLRIEPPSRELVATQAMVDATFISADPHGYDVTPLFIEIGATPVAVPLGPYPSTPVVRVNNATNPVLTYRALSGEVVGQITITTTLTADQDYIELDFQNRRVKLFDAGTESSIVAAFSGDWFTLDPADGDFALSLWPTVEVSSGGGEIIYRRRW